MYVLVKERDRDHTYIVGQRQVMGQDQRSNWWLRYCWAKSDEGSSLTIDG